MGAETVKVSCLLEGGSALDFERLQMMFKAQAIMPSRSKQQSLLIGAALLVLDAETRRFADSSGRSYPTLGEVLEFAGCRKGDVEALLKGASEGVQLSALQEAIKSQAGGSVNHKESGDGKARAPKQSKRTQREST